MGNREPVPLPFVAPQVLVINFDPVFHHKSGKRLHEVCRWNDPRTLTDGYITDLLDCSDGYVRYRVVKWRDVESIMRHVYGSWEHEETHAWNRFTLYDKVAPGRAGCGWMHYAPNSDRDYDWGNRRVVWSTCDDWLNCPQLTGERRRVNCGKWGDGDIRAHHRWWFQHLPRAEGRTDGKLNNWWAYAVDFNRFAESG